MRLSILENGFSLPQRLIIGFIHLTGGTIPGPIATMSYRRAIWGKYAAPCFQEAMRAAREWSKTETELFAAFVSKLNDCAY